MQPLCTVDHETRSHSANNVEEERPTPGATESSPLLQQYPQFTHPRNPVTVVIVSVLLIILISGFIIGVYLLVVQSDSENILPPVETPVHLVSRKQWDKTYVPQTSQLMSPYISREVMLVHTNTDFCWSTISCIKLLKEMQANATESNNVIPYNFLVSSNGETYEALGWQRVSSILTQRPYDGIVLAFIGNFTKTPPTTSQIQEAQKFFAMAVSQSHLHPKFCIVGKNVYETPNKLSKKFKRFTRMSSEFTDGKEN